MAWRAWWLLLGAGATLAFGCGGSSSWDARGGPGAGASAASGGAEAAGGAADGAGAGAAAGGGVRIDPTACFPVTVGMVNLSTVQSNYVWLGIHAWLGRQYVYLEVFLNPVRAGSFVLDTNLNQQRATCTECVLVQDYLTTPQRWFVAQQGTVQVDAFSAAARSTSGSLQGIVLQEATIDGPNSYGPSSIVAGGTCLYIEEASWNTASCEPGASCGSDSQCVASNFYTEGSCNPAGEHQLGEACSQNVPTTDCVAGTGCLGQVCASECEYWAAEPGCPAGSACVFGLCGDIEEDPAALGEACTKGARWLCGESETKWAGYCRERGAGVSCEAICRVAVATDCAPEATCEPLFAEGSTGTCVLP